MTKKLTLLVDLDNVTANLMKKWLTTYNERYFDNLTAEQITDWNMHIFAKNCSVSEFYGIIDEPNFFSDLEIMPYAIDVAKRIKDAGHELFFVTATPYKNTTGGFDKCNWVQKHFPFIGRDNVIQAHKKYMVIGDLLFDDSPRNLATFPNIKVAMDWNFNKDSKVDYRVKNWLEFEICIMKIAKSNN